MRRRRQFDRDRITMANRDAYSHDRHYACLTDHLAGRAAIQHHRQQTRPEVLDVRTGIGRPRKFEDDVVTDPEHVATGRLRNATPLVVTFSPSSPGPITKSLSRSSSNNSAWTRWT